MIESSLDMSSWEALVNVAVSRWSLLEVAGVFALVVARMAGLVLVLIPLRGTAITWRTRLAAVIVLSLVTLPVLATGSRLSAMSLPTETLGWAARASIEAGVGAILGLGVVIVIAGLRGAGEVIDRQTGWGLAGVLDPGSAETATPGTRLIVWTAVAVLFVMDPVDGHLLIVSSLLESLEAHHPELAARELLLAAYGAWDGAAGVLEWLELWHQTEWPELKVYLTSVTDNWTTISLVGPLSRDVVSVICSDIDFSGDAFPFMSVRLGTVAGVPARVFRISFSGELTYEVNVQANYGRAVWDACIEAGKRYNIAPYGTEVMHVLRAEKGFIIVGQDTDGSVTPIDAGMSGLVNKRKDFLGRRSLFRSDMLREDRKQLVGLLTDSPTEVLPDGGPVVDDPAGRIPTPILGHVTSSYYSAVLGRSIAMAMVNGGRSRMGDRVYVSDADGHGIGAVITSPVFYDPEGERQNV